MTALALADRRGWFRASRWDALLAGAAVLHGALLASKPHPALVAAALWWNANTIAHNFIHNPFFASPRMNALFSIYLSLVLGFPQSIWRARHLAHHAGGSPRIRADRLLLAQIVALALLWICLLAFAPGFLIFGYLPGLLCGLVLCEIQGRYEHHGGGAVDHRGRLYNLLCFNDGYHSAHHHRPSLHWTLLCRDATVPAASSRWPAILRWFETHPLDLLERVAMRVPRIRVWLVRVHERAWSQLLADLRPAKRIAVVGGGLFPRSALVATRLHPGARVVVIDRDAAHLEIARDLLPRGVETICAIYDPKQHTDFDLVVFPLAYDGDRCALYRSPPAPVIFIHDWIWRRNGKGVRVSLLLLKRINLVTSAPC